MTRATNLHDCLIEMKTIENRPNFVHIKKVDKVAFMRLGDNSYRQKWLNELETLFLIDKIGLWS